jgi:hypothetical protein
MRRQLLAIAAATTTAAAVAFAAPAFADGEGPEEFPGDVFCEDFEGLEFLDGVEFEEPLPTVIDGPEFEEIFPPADYDVPIVAVIVQGAESANVYFEPPFDGLTAPGDNEIFFIDICSEIEEEPTTPPPSPEPSEPPTDEPTEPVETPAPVPTEVPAGTNAGDGGSVGLWGLIAASSAAVAGAAMFARRRFLNDS